MKKIVYCTQPGLDFGKSRNGLPIFTRFKKLEAFLESNGVYSARIVSNNEYEDGLIVRVPVQFCTEENPMVNRNKYHYKPNLLTYLASPYSSGGLGNLEANFKATQLVMAEMVTRGHALISPILHGRGMQYPGSPLENHHTAAQWDQYNKRLLRRCEQFMILTLPNWKESFGVQAEIEFFRRVRPIQPIHKLDPETFEITSIN